MKLLDLFKVSQPVAPIEEPEKLRSTYNRLRWSVFFAATLGYGLYYVCRLSLNVVKKPMVDAGILSESELGMVGAGLFVTYAIGKLTNGFLADRSNIRRFMSIGLLFSALINLMLGWTTSFVLFTILWGMNGWVQSMGAAPSVVALSRWFGNKERGTYYGFWSSSHNIGEALTFIVTALLVSTFGWQWGFQGAALIGFLGVAVTAIFMRDTPESCGLPSIALYKGDLVGQAAKDAHESVWQMQKQVLRSPAIWILALSSAFMYISRYAVNSWGIFYLDAQKGYSILEASSIISISSVFGVVGTVSCGWISDRFFAGRRNLPALGFGLMNVLGLFLFFFVRAEGVWLEVVSMVIFGLAIGALTCYLGGMMAVDIASKRASGAALGVVGIASYIGAAIQDLVSGYSIQEGKRVVDGVVRYDFSFATWFWICSAAISVLLALLIWRVKPQD